MTAQKSPNLWLGGGDDVDSKWTTSTGDLHFHEYSFDDFNTEVITLEAEYDHRDAIKGLDWDETHRKWTGSTWRIDFAALDTAVKHFLDRGYNVSIVASEVSIYLSDYNAPFLEAHRPDEPPPDVEVDAEDNEQSDLGAY